MIFPSLADAHEFKNKTTFDFDKVKNKSSFKTSVENSSYCNSFHLYLSPCQVWLCCKYDMTQ